MVSAHEFWATPGPMTVLDLGAADPSDACRIVHGLILHVAWANRYGVDVPLDRLADLQLRSAGDMREHILALDAAPLHTARPPERRMIGNCRHFATLACALLRTAGVPARARCGFASVFERDKWVDHWVVERWNGDRWVGVDPQIDAFQRAALCIDDPLDLPDGYFLSAGEAWRLVRNGGADPDAFGIEEMWGPWFIRSNVVRDLAALNKMEMLPWDGWGLAEVPGGTPEDDIRIDAIAAVTTRNDLEAIRAMYRAADLTVPDEVTAYGPDGGKRVRVAL